MSVFIPQLLSVANAYVAASGCTLGAASRRAFDESKLLPNLAAGLSSPTLERTDRAMRWFSDNWPEGAAWPEGVPRPAPSPSPAPAEEAA